MLLDSDIHLHIIVTSWGNLGNKGHVRVYAYVYVLILVSLIYAYAFFIVLYAYYAFFFSIRKHCIATDTT